MKRVFTFLAILLACVINVAAQSFDEYFEDNTLRLDYIFAGDVSHQNVYFCQSYKQNRWAGRRKHLAEKMLRGNGEIAVRSHDDGTLLYVWTFSSLFQEWLLENEAKQMQRAFEASFNVPFPKQAVDVTVTLLNNRNDTLTSMTHVVDPADILIRHLKPTDIPYRYVWKGGGKSAASADDVNISACVDLAILAEGYTAAEMDKFYADSERAVEALFENEPFRSLKERFNVVAVAAPSQHSGVSVPHDGEWVNTAVGTHYDTFYTQRYLTSSRIHRFYDLLSGVPFEHILVLVNTDMYGGGGIYNQVDFATADHPTFKQVFVHEFGHSYGGLADEYAYDDMDEIWYPADIEPWEPNVTTLVDFGSKWADLMPKGTVIPTPLDPKVPHFRSLQPDDRKGWERLNASVQKVGVFEGAGYQTKGCYRPAQECRMKINEVRDFCPVCTRAIKRLTEFYTEE